MTQYKTTEGRVIGAIIACWLWVALLIFLLWKFKPECPPHMCGENPQTGEPMCESSWGGGRLMLWTIGMFLAPLLVTIILKLQLNQSDDDDDDGVYKPPTQSE